MKAQSWCHSAVPASHTVGRFNLELICLCWQSHTCDAVTSIFRTKMMVSLSFRVWLSFTRLCLGTASVSLSALTAHSSRSLPGPEAAPTTQSVAHRQGSFKHMLLHFPANFYIFKLSLSKSLCSAAFEWIIVLLLWSVWMEEWIRSVFWYSKVHFGIYYTQNCRSSEGRYLNRKYSSIISVGQLVSVHMNIRFIWCFLFYFT